MGPISFLRPSFLWGLLFIVVPVVLHLLHRRRTVRLDFSTTRFFGTTAVRASRSRRLRRLLQLLCRIGVVTAISLLFAGPYNPHDPFAVLDDPRCVVYAWIDPTVSMAYAESGTRRSQAALDALDTLARSLRPSAQIRLWDEQQERFISYELSRERSAQLRYGVCGLDAMTAQLERELRANRQPAVLVALSDMQEPTTAAIDTFLTADTLPCPVLCIPLTPRALSNRGITEAGISPANAAVLQIKMTYEGTPAGIAHVYAQSGSLRAGRVSVPVDGSDSISVETPLPQDRQALWGLAVIEDADNWPIDDTCAFIATQHSPRGVLIVGLATVAYPIAAALGASGADFWSGVTVRRPQDVRSDDIERASLVILDQLEYVPPALAPLFSMRGISRKAVIFSPSLTPAGRAITETVLRRFGRTTQLSVDSAGGASSPVLPDTLSALWRGFPRLADRTVSVHRRLGGLAGETLVRLENGIALASLAMDSSGSAWVLFSTALGACDDNNLCETGFYVPLLDRLARLALARTVPAETPWYAGLPRRNPFAGRQRGAVVFDAQGREVARWTGQMQVVIERPGAYQVAPEGESGYWIRVALSPSERTLRYRQPVPPSASAARFALVPPSRITAFVERRSSRLVLLIWILLGALVAAEMALWPRAKRPKT